MTERVLVEIQDDTTVEELRQRLPTHMSVEVVSDEVYVLVIEARDGEEEVTEVLSEAGIDCFVSAV